MLVTESDHWHNFFLQRSELVRSISVHFCALNFSFVNKSRRDKNILTTAFPYFRVKRFHVGFRSMSISVTELNSPIKGVYNDFVKNFTEVKNHLGTVTRYLIISVNQILNEMIDISPLVLSEIVSGV